MQKWRKNEKTKIISYYLDNIYEPAGHYNVNTGNHDGINLF